MLTFWALRLMVLGMGLVLMSAMASAADGDKKDPFKLPPLDDKGWKKLDNGMRVWDVKAGTGDTVPKGATIKLHYTGWLTDGTVFDSSKKRNEAITFPLNQLIKGWQEGVPGMKVGGVRLLEIPYQLAYGAAGTPDGTIPPKATLIFEIEVLELKK